MSFPAPRCVTTDKREENFQIRNQLENEINGGVCAFHLRSSRDTRRLPDAFPDGHFPWNTKECLTLSHAGREERRQMIGSIWGG